MPRSLTPQMKLLAAVTESRRYFESKIIEHANDYLPKNTPSERKIAKEIFNKLFTDRIYNIATFYYIARELSLLRSDNLHKLIDTHNADMRDLASDHIRLAKMHLSTTETSFAQIDNILVDKMINHNPRDDNDHILLDVSDLCRFLVPMMMPSSCRATVKLLSQSGIVFISGYERKFINTKGILETIFHDHLTLAVDLHGQHT